MEEQELSPLDRINQEFGLPVSSISKGPEPLSPPASAPAMPAAAPTPSALDSINQQFGISFETPIEKPAVAPTAAGPAPGTEVAPQAPGRIPPAIAPPPREYTGGGSGWEREPTTTERVVETFAPPKPTAEMGTAERLGRHFAGGVLGTAEGLGGALQWVTGGALGKDFSNYMADLRKQVTPEGEASFIDQLASGAGSMATFFIPGFGAARGASLVGRFAPKAAQWLGAGTMAVTEAATEAGQVYRDELEKGKGEGKAGTAASWTFWLNLPVLTLTDKLAFFGNEGKALSRALRGMVTEGSQESLQEVISTWSQEEQQNLKNILTSGAVGAILGGGVGAIAKPIGKTPAPGAQETVPPAIGQGEIAPTPPPVLPPGARADVPPAAPVEPAPVPLPPAPPEAEVPPEVVAAPPSPVVSPPVPEVTGFEVTKTRKGWSVAGMDFTNQADAEAFAAKAAAADTEAAPPPVVRPDSPMGVTQDNVAPEPTKAKTVPTEAKTVPEVEKTVPKTPDQPLDVSGTATQAAATKIEKAPEAPFKMPSAEVLAGMSDADLEALAEQVKAAGVDVEALGTGTYAVNEPGQGDPFLDRLKALRQEAMTKVPGAVVAPAGALSAEPAQAQTQPFTDYIQTGIPGARAVAPAPEAPTLPPDAWRFPRNEYVQEGLKDATGSKAELTKALMAEHERSVEEAMQKQEPNLSWEQIGDYPELAQKYIPETPTDDVWPYGEAPNIPASWRSETPVQTRDKKITEHEQIVGQTKVNAITYSKFIDMVKTQNWPEVQNELHLSSANFTRDAFDHNFNPLNLMARLVEGGVPRAEAKVLVKDYEAQAFKPVREGLGAKKETKALSPEMEAVAAFNKKFGGAARVGIPEAPQGVDLTGLAPDIDPVATGFLPATKSPTSLPTYKNFPTEKLELVPDIFQHKREADPLTGGGLSLTDIEKYDQTAAGNISVFETKDGRFLVSNGHQRTNAAKRLNEPTVGIQVRREVDGWTQQEVRVASALENLKGGTVDALDIGSYLRETGLTADNLASKGVSLTKSEVQKGIGLSGLPDRIWQDVYRGVWGHHGDAQAVEKGAALGALRENAAAQEAIYKRLMELQGEGKDISLPAIRNLVDAGRVAIVTEGQQQGLFGDEEVVNSRIFERAALVTYIQKELTTDKNAHLAANRERDRLEAAGNVIDAKANKAIAERAKEVLGVFGRSSKVGWTETSRVLNEFAERFAQAKDLGEENAIKKEALAEIHSALEADYQAIGRADLGQATGRGAAGKEPGFSGGERGPGAPLGVREPGYERPLSKFEKRLNGITSAYPNADPERVAQALRAAPKSSDREIAGLAAMKPGEASGVVRGNLTAMQRAELAKRSGVPGAALFPEMGMGGGGTLFDQAPEPARVPAGARPAVEKSAALTEAPDEWGMVAHPGGQAEAKEMAQRMGEQDSKNEYRARVDEIGQWIIEKKVAVSSPTPGEFDHLRTSPDETTGKVGDRTIKQEALFKTGEIPLKETENGKNAPNQAGVEGRPESDLSPDREATRRQFEDFRRGVDQELPGSQGWRAFSNAEYAEELGNSQEFDVIRQEAKVFGLSAIPVKNMGPSGAIVRDYGEQPLLIINADVKSITPTQVVGHEIFHDRRYKGHQSATNIVNAVDLNSNTTKSYIEWIGSIRKQLGIESLSSRGVMEEIAADYAAGIEKFEYNGVSYNLKDCFRDAKQIDLYLERYKESPTTEPSVNALYGYDKPKYSTPENRQGWVAPGEPVPSFKEFEADLAKDDYARERELRDPANKLIPLYEGETFLGTRGGDFIKDAKGKTVKLTNEDIYERLYAPKTTTLPIGTETANPEDLLGTPEEPGPEGTVEKPPGYAGSLIRSVREKFSAANISEKSRLAHQFIVEHLGWAAREVKKDATILDKYSERFGKMTREDLIKFTDAAETGQLDQVAPDLQEAGQAWRRISDGLHSLLVNAKGGESAYWENYFPRLFENPEQAAIAIAAMLKSRGTSLTGPESFNKVRTQLLFSDSIKPVEEGGLGLTPRYPNYVDMMKANIYEKMRFLTGKYIEADLKEAGFITKAKTPGWEALTGDKTLEGYYAHPDVARVMENFLSKGLRGDPLFELYNNPVSFVNTVLVGMSAFHATFSTFSDLAHGIGSNLTRAIGAAVTGRFGLSGHYLAEMAKAANIPANVIRGGKLGEEYTTPGSHPEMAPIVDLMTKAGIRFESPGFVDTLKAIFKPGGVSQTEMGQMSKSFAEVAAQQMGVPRKIMESIAWPIMSYLVPRLKINATARLLQMELDTLARDGKLKEMTPQDLTQLAQEVARKSDNIFGQMVYDNLSMKRGMRDGLRILVGFPGWNIGSFTDILQAGKGIKHIGWEGLPYVKDVIVGKITGRPVAPYEKMSRSERMSMEFYLGTAMVMAVFGALMQKMLAGDWPEDYKDLFMPRTGELMSNGQPERLRAPTYMRDVLSLNHPVEMMKHKLNWPLRMVSALVDNKDFFGEEIRDPFASVGTQAGQTAKYVAKSMLPFGVQGFMATESPKAKALNLIGITRVPRLYSNTESMNILDIYNTQNRATMTSKEAAEQKRLKGELRKFAKAGDEDGFKEAAQAAMSEGTLTRQQVKAIVTESQEPPGLGRFSAVPLEWQARALQVATDAEKRAWTPLFLKKVAQAKTEILVRNKSAVVPILEDMGLTEMADTIKNLEVSEKAKTFNLSALGVRKPPSEMGDLDQIDLSLAKTIQEQAAKEGTEKAKKNKKPSRYAALGF